MEIYKSIQGYDDIYKVSNYGNVTSCGKLIKQEVVRNNHTNYRRVSLSKHGKVKRFQVHRLVALYFIDNPSNLPIVNHKDNNGENNHYSNLEWTTHKGNMQHAQLQGRLYNSQSLGGKAAGVKARDKQIVNLNNYIGKTVGFIKVNSVVKLGKHPKANVTCTKCGNSYDTDFSSILKGVSTSCRACAISQANQTMVENTIKSLNNCTVNNRKISEVVFVNKKYKGWVTCLDCNKSRFMYLHPILRKTNPTLCTCRK